jgi:hypothetical protein
VQENWAEIFANPMRSWGTRLKLILKKLSALMGVDWIHLVQNKNELQNLVYTAMIIEMP